MNRDKYLKLSQQQAEANEGKAASSRNGLSGDKHFILEGEDPEAFLRPLRPVGDSEGLVLQRIAAAQWRLDRAFALETELRLSKGQNDPFPPDPHEPDDLLARAFMQDGKGPDNFTRLFRYETARRPGSPHALEPPAPEPPNPPLTPSDSMNYKANPETLQWRNLPPSAPPRHQ